LYDDTVEVTVPIVALYGTKSITAIASPLSCTVVWICVIAVDEGAPWELINPGATNTLYLYASLFANKEIDSVYAFAVRPWILFDVIVS
jgi:hypothetical protein